MKIQNLNVTDRNIFTSDSGYKLFLMDRIIDNFSPMFNSQIDRKKSQLNEHMEDIKKLTIDIKDGKSRLKSLLLKITQEKIKKEILSVIQELNSRDVLYGKNKQVVKDVLFNIDKSSEQELSRNLNSLKKMSVS